MMARFVESAKRSWRQISDYLNLRPEELAFITFVCTLTALGAGISALRLSATLDGDGREQMTEQARAFRAYAQSSEYNESLDSLAEVVLGRPVLATYWKSQRDSLLSLLKQGTVRTGVDSFFAQLGDEPVRVVNLNEATAEELASLPGIGPKTAERIVTYRTEHGNFKAASDLQRVRGIGKKLFAKIQPFIDIH